MFRIYLSVHGISFFDLPCPQIFKVCLSVATAYKLPHWWLKDPGWKEIQSDKKNN
jgi:hypothetical protein